MPQMAHCSHLFQEKILCVVKLSALLFHLENGKNQESPFGLSHFKNPRKEYYLLLCQAVQEKEKNLLFIFFN